MICCASAMVWALTTTPCHDPKKDAAATAEPLASASDQAARGRAPVHPGLNVFVNRRSWSGLLNRFRWSPRLPGLIRTSGFTAMWRFLVGAAFTALRGRGSDWRS